MKKTAILFLTASSLILTACSNTAMQEQNADKTAMARNKVNFQLPPSQKWDLVSVEQDANGYAKSYRSVGAKGLSADQSFYINYGKNIRTPLLESMHEVVGSLASTGCKHTDAKRVKLDKNILIFTASANQCMSGRSISQTFKVFNMNDGQYSIVYSANPNAVPNKTRQQMKSVVMNATISPINGRA
ncbi:MAG TPA: hypothetical protein VLI69_06595 [Gammaproteobacteria bacterium]|nr:hypothetical protein [Gammaproteobacteria bacterium]